VGASYERLQFQYPQTHTQTAYAGTADVQYAHDMETQNGIGHHIGAAYSLRTATRVLDSDFVYTRHFWTVDYALSKGRHLVGAHFQGGLITGNAPLFERFSLGNSYTLRGWDKFDVAPLGGARSAHGSLEYRYNPFQVFYDVGTVWNPNETAHVRHALGFGLVLKCGAFVSLAFPVRLNHVSPVFMLGFRD
jgi:outer membrane translocation and assembly module TamA